MIRYGIDFTIIEKNEGVTPLSKALGTQSRTLEIYEQIGLAEKALARGEIASRIQLISGGKIHDGFDLSAMGAGISPYPYMLVLEQSKTEQMFYEYLQVHQRDVRWGTTLESFTQDDTGVEAVIKQNDSQTETITAQYLVGCDGAGSFVRKSLGLSLVGDTFGHMFYVADTEMESNLAHDTLSSVLAKDAFTFFFPMPGGDNRWRIIGSLSEYKTNENLDFRVEALESKVKAETQLPLEITAVNWFSTYKVHTRRVDQFSLGRCFLAGDSAHIHTPAGGQGMNTGIQDAYNLAWKLGLVIKGYADESLLETYNQERLENAKNLVESTDRLFELEAGGNQLVSLFRTLILPPIAKYIFAIKAVQRVVYSMISQTGIHYADSKLSQSLRSQPFEVKPGDRMPYFEVEGRSIYDRLHAPKFHLLTFAENGADYLALEEKVNHDYSHFVDYHTLPLSDAVTEIFGTQAPFSLLLRPDNYVGLVFDQKSIEPLEQYFSAIYPRKGVASPIEKSLPA
ncbi:MAG: FAD-dependent monooxygenase [Phormidesmis sp.]